MTEQDSNDKRKEDIIDGIKSMFLENIDQNMRNVIGAELDRMLHGIYMAVSASINEMGHMYNPDMEETIPVMDSHLKRTFRAYLHAKEKHPYFADRIIDNYNGGTQTPRAIRAMTIDLANMRLQVAQEMQDNMLKPSTVLACEVAEIHQAYAQGDMAHAVEECYDAIAVLLRMVDVLEGRQALGEPAKEGAKKEGDEE